MPAAVTNGGHPTSIILHGRIYSLPTRPTVVICIDGFDPTYLHQGIEDGILPNLKSFVTEGFSVTAKCAMPSLTNPNNLSIITGAPTSIHGMSGNYYLDTKTGEEVMITDATLLKGSTILAELAKADVQVFAITAKDKLRRILCAGLNSAKDGSVCFSAQNARDATLREHGIENVEAWLQRPQPEQYSGDLSLFVLDAGLQLLAEGRTGFFYLTLSDFIQHHHAPGSPKSNAFMAAIDSRIGNFIGLGAVVAVTGDHGMNDKCLADGTPNVLFLEDILNERWPECGARVICPIADPFVKHHGALGGFVRVHFLGEKPDENKEVEILDYLRNLPQVEVAYTGAEAAVVFQTPPEREGDLAVVSVQHAVIGSRADEHDLSMMVDHRLRSHGGLSEQEIPVLKSEPLRGPIKKGGWRNFDIFDVALNYN